MKHKQIFLNAATTFAQVLANSVALFVLYRFLIRTIGIERLGIWSLVLATTSMVTLVNQGLSTGIVKFVAKYAARGQSEDVSLLMQTAVISVGIGLAVVSLVLYPGAKWVLQAVLPHARLAEAAAILPFAFVSLWITVLTGTFQAGLVGHESIDVCNYAEIGGILSYLGLSLLLVPKHGLVGLAWAQVVQGSVFLLLTWALLRRKLPTLPVLPHRWSPSLFREIAGYGAKFQLITAAQALREPATKALLTKFGGLAMTGFYDLAMRLVFTLRELIVQSCQVLIPTVSHLHERESASIPALYRDAYRLIFFLAVPAFASLAILSPLVSRIWIGRYEPIFVEFAATLAAAWLVNALSNPAFVVDVGTGALRWVLAGCILTAVLNPVLASFAGHCRGGKAVVAASAFSLVVGYAVILVAYHVENGVSFSELLPRESWAVVTASVASAFICLRFPREAHWASISAPRAMGEGMAMLAAIVLMPMWLHPLRRRLFRWVAARVTA